MTITDRVGANDGADAAVEAVVRWASGNSILAVRARVARVGAVATQKGFAHLGADSTMKAVVGSASNQVCNTESEGKMHENNALYAFF